MLIVPGMMRGEGRGRERDRGGRGEGEGEGRREEERKERENEGQMEEGGEEGRGTVIYMHMLDKCSSVQPT